jgi:hypothetical protein
MTESAWHLPQHGPGRLYQLARDLKIKYDDLEHLHTIIAEQLRTFIKLECSVRLLLDGERVNPCTTVISVPFQGDDDKIFNNLATMIRDQLWGYYLSADPKGTHHGLTNLVFDGNITNLIRREGEKFLHLLTYRNDLAGRVMKDYKMACDMPPFSRDVYMKEVVQKNLDIHLGVRMYNHGEGVNRVTIFLPIMAGDSAIDRIYYNIEHITHMNVVAYDELHDRYLPVSEELILRELEGTLERARRKNNTRKKIINGLKFHTVLMEDPSLINHVSIADLYYDKINRIDLLEETAQRSRDMFASALIRSTEITSAAIDINELKLEERVYIERPATRETVPAQPSAGRQTQQETKVPLTVTKDGLTEL